MRGENAFKGENTEEDEDTEIPADETALEKLARKEKERQAAERSARRAEDNAQWEEWQQVLSASKNVETIRTANGVWERHRTLRHEVERLGRDCGNRFEILRTGVMEHVDAKCSKDQAAYLTKMKINELEQGTLKTMQTHLERLLTASWAAQMGGEGVDKQELEDLRDDLTTLMDDMTAKMKTEMTNLQAFKVEINEEVDQLGNNLRTDLDREEKKRLEVEQKLRMMAEKFGSVLNKYEKSLSEASMEAKDSVNAVDGLRIWLRQINGDSRKTAVTVDKIDERLLELQKLHDSSTVDYQLQVLTDALHARPSRPEVSRMIRTLEHYMAEVTGVERDPSDKDTTMAKTRCLACDQDVRSQSPGLPPTPASNVPSARPRSVRSASPAQGSRPSSSARRLPSARAGGGKPRPGSTRPASPPFALVPEFSRYDSNTPTQLQLAEQQQQLAQQQFLEQQAIQQQLAGQTSPAEFQTGLGYGASATPGKAAAPKGSKDPPEPLSISVDNWGGWSKERIDSPDASPGPSEFNPSNMAVEADPEIAAILDNPAVIEGNGESNGGIHVGETFDPESVQVQSDGTLAEIPSSGSLSGIPT
ncbi:hypothetical protein CYMTET_7377 [Cymbomonas tetramitiformis]|uniref:Uncharacterized protein n=1 Tax=Cymbomonas tetramitiformis TaxID=36881 RepID=A0AAE0LH32_9CHLO|nr:hypothetical protein CYMTET_7377 [Cymbomonas tetramitiformis]